MTAIDVSAVAVIVAVAVAVNDVTTVNLQDHALFLVTVGPARVPLAEMIVVVATVVETVVATTIDVVISPMAASVRGADAIVEIVSADVAAWTTRTKTARTRVKVTVTERLWTMMALKTLLAVVVTMIVAWVEMTKGQLDKMPVIPTMVPILNLNPARLMESLSLSIKRIIKPRRTEPINLSDYGIDSQV